MNDRIRYYQATEALEDGEFVSDCGDGIQVKKCNMVDMVPLGRIRFLTYQYKVEAGDNVAIESLWEFGRLMETITIGKCIYCRGDDYRYVKIMVEDGSLSLYYRKLERDREIKKKVMKLEWERRELWK